MTIAANATDEKLNAKTPGRRSAKIFYNFI